MKLYKSHTPCTINTIVDHTTTLEDFSTYLIANFKRLQLSLKNTSDLPQLVSLWGYASGGSITGVDTSGATSTTTTINTSVATGVHPQDVVYYGDLSRFYVINQLSDTISIIDDNGTLIDTIALSDTIFTSPFSGVKLLINENARQLYVLGSLSNSVAVIELATNTIIDSYPTDERPLDMVFDSTRQLLYTANAVAKTISVIDLSSAVESSIAIGKTPRALALNPVTGDLFVALLDAEILVYDNLGNLVTTIITDAPITRLLYHPVTKHIYGLESSNNSIVVIASDSYTITQRIVMANAPDVLTYNSLDNYLYVGSSTTQVFTLFNTANTVEDTAVITPFNRQLLVVATDNLFGYATTDTANGLLHLSLTKTTTDPVIISEDYYSYLQETIHDPMLIKHVKIVLSDGSNLHSMKLIEKRPTGMQNIRTLSLANYTSPQNPSENVLELFEMENEMLSGWHSWQFYMQPKQRITILLYYCKSKFKEKAIAINET